MMYLIVGLRDLRGIEIGGIGYQGIVRGIVCVGNILSLFIFFAVRDAESFPLSQVG